MPTHDANELSVTLRQLRQEHRGLEARLVQLRRDAARLRLGAISKCRLEGEIYELWVKLEEHATAEESVLVPLLPRVAADDEARIRLMLHEHDLQRRLLLSTLDLTEPGLLSRTELIAVATRLVRTLRADIALEDELLEELVFEWISRARPPDSGAHRSR
jgi:iron-sulfur cluster repair protein YtfE (RIC family)